MARAQRRNRKRVPAGKPDPATKPLEAARPVPTTWLAVFVVLVITFAAVYSPTLRFQYVYDDVEQVVENPNIQSWSYLPDYFTKHLWSQLGWYQVRFYRPFFLVWLRMNHALFGLNAHYWHLTTVGAHLLATLLVYQLVYTFLRNWASAALSALFFALHPVHVEVAAWISASSEALLAASLMASLACYARGTIRKDPTRTDWRWISGSLVFYASALLFKETALVFPAIIFTFALLWFDHDSDRPESLGRIGFGRAGFDRARSALIRAMPFLLLTIVYLAVRWSVLKAIVPTTVPIGLRTLALTVPSLLLFYGRLLLWPLRLSPFYNTPLVTQPGLANFVVPVLAIVAVGGALALLYWKTWKATKASEDAREAKEEWRLLLLAGAWMVIFLLPALDLFALQNGLFVQDRYLYVPSIGFSILLALGLSRLGRGSRGFSGMSWAQAMIALVLAVAMAVGARAQSKIWANNVTLFTRAVERDPDSRIAQHDLAAALVDAGRYPEAIKLLQELLRQDPDDPVDNNNLGQAYLNLGDREHAEVFLAKSCQLHPTPKQLYQLGAVRFNLHRPEAAEQALTQALAMDPNGAGYHYALGLALEQLGKPKSAIEAFKKELAVNPGDTRSQQELARLSAGGQQPTAQR